MPIGQNLFRGFIPRLPAHLQPENGTYRAMNCDFTSGELRALQADTVVDTSVFAPLATTQATFAHRRKDGDYRVFNFDKDTFCVSSPNAEDTHERYYFTPGDTGGVYVFSAKEETYQNKIANNPVGKKVGLPTVDASAISVEAISNLENRTALEGLIFKWFSFWEVDGKVVDEKEITPVALGFNDSGNINGQFDLLPQERTSSYHAQEVKFKSFTVDKVPYDVSVIPGAYIDSSGAGLLKIVSATELQVGLGTTSVTSWSSYIPKATDEIINAAGASESMQEYVRRLWLLQGKDDELPVAGLKLIAKDERNIEVFTLYSNGSVQGAHSNTSIIPGGMSMTLKHVGGTANTYAFEVRFSNYETRSYAITLVNIYGEESAPVRTDVIDLNYFQDAKFKATNVSISDYANYVALKGIRLYRSADLGNGSAEFLLVFDSTEAVANPTATSGLLSVAITATHASFEYIDHKKTEDLGMALFTDPNWLPPPDGIRALCVMRNGIMCAYKESTVYFAHAYRPYAWDRTKSITFPQSVRALMPFSNGLLVFTSGPLFFVAGQSADALSYQQVQGAHGLILNERAWVETDRGAVFATDDGLCVTDGNTVSNELSLQLLTRKGWQALFAGGVMPRIRLAWWDGKLVVYATKVPRGFLIDFDEAEGQVTTLSGFDYVTCHLRWPDPDNLIFVEAAPGRTRYVMAFHDTAKRRAISYVSRLYELPQPVCFASMQIRQEGTSTIHLFKDDHPDAVDVLTPTTLSNTEKTTATDGAGVTVVTYRPKNGSTAACPFSKPPSCTITCTGDNIIRLPSGFKARKWWYLIQRDENQTGAVRALHLALSANELKGV